MKRFILFLLFVCLVSILETKAQNEPLFFFEQFLNARIHYKNRSVTVAPMNYDAVNDKMYFKRDGQLMELVRSVTIDSIVWGGKLCFVPYKDGFLEKVKLANGIAYIHWHIKNVNIGSRGALGAVTQAKVDRVYSAGNKQYGSGDIYRKKNANDYYLSIDGKLVKVTTLKQLLKQFPEHQEAIKTFIEEQSVNLRIPQSVLNLLDFCLSLN